ncbi:MAG: GNAT family N-acetyltransferase [Candidatus Taylorbacteria bacterium]
MNPESISPNIIEKEEKLLQTVSSQDAVSEFNEIVKDDTAYQEWNEKYSLRPAIFFSSSNLEKIRSLSPGKRLLFFSLSSSSLTVTPSDAEMYFDYFPDDFEAIRIGVSKNQLPRNKVEFNIWAISAHRLFENDINPLTGYKNSNRWQGINERKSEAPYHLLSEDENIYEQIESFGDVSKNIRHALDMADLNPADSHKHIRVNDLFEDQKYENLDNSSKSQLLCLCVKYLQNALVFHETYNSGYTKESVDESNSIRVHSAQNDHFRSWSKAYSMLFKTFQPSSAYNTAQSSFEYEMDNTASSAGFVEEYPFHRILLKVLKEYAVLGANGDRGDVDLMVDFWSKNSNPIFANSVADALNAIDGQYASVKLMEHMHTNDNTDKTAIAAILYRIEFKRIGISTDGVEYLNRVYDLGALNNPDYFVQRLSNDGKIGIFNKDEQLQKYFDLGDISETSRNISANVLDFTYDTLFNPHENETAEEKSKREQYLEEFKARYVELSNDKTFSNNFRLNNLSLKEQGALIIMLHELDQDSKNRLTDLTKNRGESGLRVFLHYYEIDPSVAIKTLNLISVLPQDLDSYKLLELLANISSYLSRLDDEYETIVEKTKGYEDKGRMKSNEMIVKKSVIPQAKRMILEQVDNIVSRILSENISDGETIRQYVENIKPEAIVIQTILKSSRGSFETADMNDMPLISKIEYMGGEGEANSPEFIKSIRSLYKKNYQDKPKLLKRLLASLEVSRKSSRTLFSVAEFNNQPIGYCAFEFEDNGSIHFGKFNIDPDFSGRQVGEQMLEETLDDYAITHIIRAECDRNTRIASKYIEKGFIAYNEYPLDEITCWDIVRNDSMNEELATKSLSKKYIMDHMIINSWESLGLSNRPEDAMVYATTATNFKSYTLNLSSLGEGYAVTRMFREKTTNGEELVIIVAEKIGEKMNQYQNDFQLTQMIETRHSIIL